MKTISSVASGLALLALAACEQMAADLPSAPGETSGATQTASVAPAPAAPPTSPASAFRIERVTPQIPAGADLGWFTPGEGSPREVGSFVGAAVIEGVEGVFSGARGATLEVDIRQFRPAIALEARADDSAHRVKLDFTLRDSTSGEVIGKSENLFMDLIALTGSAGIIARNAGRTPEIRLTERIAKITSAWARSVSCAEFACPQATVLAAAPAPTPAPAPQPTAVEPAPAPAEEVVVAPEPAPAPEPEPTAVAEVEAAPETAPASEAEAPVEDDSPNLFETIAAALAGDGQDADAEDPAPAAVAEEAEPVVEETPVVETEPVEEPVVAAAPEAATEADEPDTIETFFSRLFAPEETEAAAEEAVAEAPSDPQPAPAPAPTPVAEPVPVEPVAPTPVETAQAAPAPDPAPAPEPVFQPAPSPESETDTQVALAPAPAPAAAPSQATQPVTTNEQPRRRVEAGSPFFRSPASSVPTLPQQALLGRSQRQNDPVRRRVGDVVLEVANLPAFWDGDQTTGGLWVALPYIPAYRRAVVTNPVNGRTVEANLFFRDPQAGGGSTLLSSAAAEALGVAPGQVANLGVKIINAD